MHTDRHLILILQSLTMTELEIKCPLAYLQPLSFLYFLAIPLFHLFFSLIPNPVNIPNFLFVYIFIT